MYYEQLLEKINENENVKFDGILDDEGNHYGACGDEKPSSYYTRREERLGKKFDNTIFFNLNKAFEFIERALYKKSLPHIDEAIRLLNNAKIIIECESNNEN